MGRIEDEVESLFRKHLTKVGVGGIGSDVLLLDEPRQIDPQADPEKVLWASVGALRDVAFALARELDGMTSN